MTYEEAKALLSISLKDMTQEQKEKIRMAFQIVSRHAISWGGS